MATDFDPYQILEVPRSAGQAEIDEAYRRQWAAYPSDAAPEARLREIQAAYRILSDADERRAYDERLSRRTVDGGPVPAQPAEAGPAPAGPASGRQRVPWGLMDIFLGAVIAIGLGILIAVPFEIIANAIASGPVKEDGNALGWELVGSAGFEFALGFVVWLFAVRKYRINWDAIGLRRPERGSWWLSFSLVVTALVIIGFFQLFLELIDKHPDTDLGHAAYVNLFPATVLVLLTVFCAPVMEETFFRGFAFRGFSGRWGVAWGAIASGALFGLAHSLNPGGLYIMFPITVIGILFAWGAWYSKSILPTIGAHFLFNGLQITVALLAPPEDNKAAMIAPAFAHILQTMTGWHI